MSRRTIAVGVLVLLGLLALGGCRKPPPGTLGEQWRVDRSGQAGPGCVLISGARLYRTIIDKSRVILIVDPAGRVSIRSDELHFGFDDPQRFELRVDQQPPVFGAQAGGDGRIAILSEAASEALLRQFQGGREVRVQVTFSSTGETVAKTFALTGFVQAWGECTGAAAPQAGAADAPH